MIKMNVSFPCSASAFVYIKPMITKLAVINLNWRYVAVFQNLPFIRFMTRGTKSVDEFDDPEGEEFKGPIPRDKLTISYVRGSGPGGQNVNKLNTKVEVRMNLENADWISDRAKNRISKLYRSRISKAGDIIVTSHKYRTQGQNLSDALKKLESFIREAYEVPQGPSELTQKRIKILKRKYERKRLTDKKYNSLRKMDRKFEV